MNTLLISTLVGEPTCSQRRMRSSGVWAEGNVFFVDLVGVFNLTITNPTIGAGSFLDFGSRKFPILMILGTRTIRFGWGRGTHVTWPFKVGTLVDHLTIVDWAGVSHSIGADITCFL